MFDALSIGATGMQAQQLNVDTIANNLANVNTTGFKKSRVSFSDLVSQETQRSLAAQADQDAGVVGGLAKTSGGVGVGSLSKLFDMGDLRKTESALDVAIQGDGFFEVSMPDGTKAFTRGGTLKIGRDGQLATQSGHPIKPGLSIPENAQSMTITADGHVKVQTANQSNPIEVGRIDLVRFTNPAALSAQGDNLYRESENSGEPIAGRPGEDGTGFLAQGFLEGSNVKMVDEMVNLMVAQRAYEASVKVVQAADEMLGMINNLRK
jgi:flagellar basal-body rod protein FlgG